MAVESKGFVEWRENLYTPELFSDEEVEILRKLYEYQGFNQNEVILAIQKVFPEAKEAAEAIIICAMKGPKRAAMTKMRNGKTLEQHGIPASGMKGAKGLSCARITAATADLAAYYLKRMNFPKRIGGSCPGWLQFPSAGSIKLPDDLRVAHLDFSRKFSPMIGGVFNEQIYQTMMNNAYLNPKLKLFDDLVYIPSSIMAPVTSPVVTSSASQRPSAPRRGT